MMRTLAVVVLAVLSGCEGSVQVSHLADGSSEDCAPSSTPRSLDIAFAEGYEVTLVVENVGLGDARIDRARIEIWRGEIPAGEPFYEFFFPLTVRVEAGAEQAIQALVVPAQAVNAVLLRAFPEYSNPGEIPISEVVSYRETITVGVTLEGEGVGADAELLFPLQLCYGCLVVCPSESAGPSGALCEAATTPASQPWIIGQDEEIDCRLCAPMYGAEFCRSLCP